LEQKYTKQPAKIRRIKMPTYIEYINDDGSTILIELSEESGGVVRASREGVSVVESGMKFKEAFASIRGTIKDLIAEMEVLQVEEGKVKFGLKALAEAGVFAVGKIGGEMNYEVSLKWKKTEGMGKLKVSK
jgi:predicted nuclease with TOPRIM domain